MELNCETVHLNLCSWVNSCGNLWVVSLVIRNWLILRLGRVLLKKIHCVTLVVACVGLNQLFRIIFRWI